MLIYCKLHRYTVMFGICVLCMKQKRRSHATISPFLRLDVSKPA